jgi:hypothetical protein
MAKGQEVGSRNSAVKGFFLLQENREFHPSFSPLAQADRVESQQTGLLRMIPLGNDHLVSKRRNSMRTEARWISRVGVVSLAAVLVTSVGLRVVHGQSQHVRWDIISVDLPITTISPGGVAFAQAPNHVAPATPLRIRLTGSGTFVAPASGRSTHAVTGGGTWQTYVGATLTGSGTYWVTELASWEFANFQTPGLIDLIGNANERANGNAVLRIQYSDGSEGILGIGCHGPGAPNGIVEGVIATKDYVTYWSAEAPTPTLNENRTLFHVQ